MAPKTYPVIELFGPTIQGEGIHAGETAHFVRFGGCDFRCDWCDTPHAVIPEEVRRNKKDLTATEIASRVKQLGAAKWVVITGGNPALHDLTDLVIALQRGGYKVSAETQATRVRPWLLDVDSLCLSPKPPSSGQGVHWGTLHEIVSNWDVRKHDDADMFLKVVVFTEKDYEYARNVHLVHPQVPMFVSAGNDAGRTVGNPDRIDRRDEDTVRLDLIAGYRKLTERVLSDPLMWGVTTQAQQHVLLWGNKQGV